MAKGPGLGLALAAGAALLLMTRKKDEPSVGDGPADGGDSDADVGGGPVGGGGSGSGSGGGTANPPNLSGNSQGYNTELWPDPKSVRQALANLGYTIQVNDEPVGSEQTKNPGALAFQRDYNKAVEDGMEMQYGSQAGKALLGKLEEDGWAGPNMLNALEAAYMKMPNSVWKARFGL